MTDLTADERRVLDAVDDAAIIQDLGALVAIPSVGGSPAELAVQQWCGDRLRAIGMSVDEWPIDVAHEQLADGFPGMEVDRTAALGCVGVMGDSVSGTIGEDARMPALALCGHTDVVPPGDTTRWPGGDPFVLRVKDGVARGRGVCDMKGGLAAMIGAVAALSSSEVSLPQPVAVHCVSAEEDGGLGAFATLRRGHLARCCVIAEPTAVSVIPANAGSLTFRIEIPGRSTHGSMRYAGVSAIDKLEGIRQALRSLEVQRNALVPDEFAHLELAWPLSIGVVRAGEWASTVPDLLVAEGRYGVRPGESVEAAARDFETAVGAACSVDSWLRDHPAVVTWPGGVFAPGALPPGHPLLLEVCDAAAAVRGAAPEVRGAPYGSDLRHYAAAGVATVQYGPGRIHDAHAIDEQVAVAHVLGCARVYALLAYRLSRRGASLG